MGSHSLNYPQLLRIFSSIALGFREGGSGPEFNHVVNGCFPQRSIRKEFDPGCRSLWICLNPTLYNTNDSIILRSARGQCYSQIGSAHRIETGPNSCDYPDNLIS